MTKPAEDSGTDTDLPLFPLQTVLLPGMTLPLHLFEPRYRQLAADLVSGRVPNREFGVVAIKASRDREIDSLGHVHAVGCTAVLREAERLPDGRFEIITIGKRRFTLTDIDKSQAPYLIGSVRWIPDQSLPKNSEVASHELGQLARAAHRKYCEAAWNNDDWIPPPRDIAFAELAYRLATDCLLTLTDRQRLLEETQPLRRLRTITRLLNTEAGLLTTLRAVPIPTSDITDNSPPTLN